MTRKTLLRFTVVVLLVVIGCGGSERPSALGALTRSVGLAEDEPLAAEVIDIVVDASDGSPGSLATVEATLDVVLPYAADRPGTDVRLWALGLELADTRLLATVTSGAAKRRGERARTVEAQRFVATSHALLLQAATPIFDTAAKKQSPIAEAISRIAYARVPSERRRRVIIVTDGRQVGGELRMDFECARVLPDAQGFVRRLHAHALLAPGTLARTDVHFAFVTVAPMPNRRCPVTLARAHQTEELWRAALTAAGAASVEFTTDAPRLAPRTTPEGTA